MATTPRVPYPAIRHINDPPQSPGPGIGHAGHAPGFSPIRQGPGFVMAMSSDSGTPVDMATHDWGGQTADNSHINGQRDTLGLNGYRSDANSDPSQYDKNGSGLGRRAK